MSVMDEYGSLDADRRTRTRLRRSETMILNDIFKVNKYPTKTDLEMVSRRTGLNTRFLCRWWQNKRTRERKKLRELGETDETLDYPGGSPSGGSPSLNNESISPSFGSDDFNSGQSPNVILTGSSINAPEQVREHLQIIEELGRIIDGCRAANLDG